MLALSQGLRLATALLTMPLEYPHRYLEQPVPWRLTPQPRATHYHVRFDRTFSSYLTNSI